MDQSVRAVSTGHIEHPNDLTQAYQSYKKSTALVTKWLLDNGQLQQPQQQKQRRRGKSKSKSRPKNGPAPGLPKQLPIQELLKLADTAAAGQEGGTLDVPDYVYQALQVAIDLRRRVTVFFMKNLSSAVEKNKSHAHFTDSLQDIFVKLGGRHWKENCQHGAAVVSPSGRQTLGPPNIAGKGPAFGDNDCGVETSGLFSNKFAALEKALEDLEIVEEPEAEGEEVNQWLPKQNTKAKQPKAPAVLGEYGIEDDELLGLCEQWMYIRTLDFIFNAVISYWGNLRGGRLSQLLVASWLTNAMFQRALCEVRAASIAEPSFSDHKNLIKAILHIRGLGSDSPPGIYVLDWDGEFSEGPGLVFPWLDLVMLRDAGNRDEASKPAENIRETEIMAASMNQFVKAHVQVPFGIGMYPLMTEFKAFIELQIDHHIDKPSVDTALVFGLHLLGAIPQQMASKDYLRSSVAFSSDVRANLVAALGDEGVSCMCEICGGNALHVMMSNFKSDLDTYISEGTSGSSQFDPYLDNSWTVGAHTIEILSWATDVGLRLCSRKSYLVTVLHLYNMLRQLGLLEEEMPLFDGLCEFLREKIFLGADPPRRNFRSCFLRSIGARLRHGDHKELHHIHQEQAAFATIAEARAGRRNRNPTSSNAWTLKPPSGDQEYAARLNPHFLSLFYSLDNQRYSLSVDQWAQVYSIADSVKHKPWRHPPSPNILKRKDMHQGLPWDRFPDVLAKLKSAVSHEFEGPFPCARVNYFKVFMAATEILRIAVITAATTVGSTSGPKGAKTGRHFSELLFEFVDSRKEGAITPAELMLPHMTSLRSVREAILRVMRGWSSSTLAHCIVTTTDFPGDVFEYRKIFG